ncbi:glycosyltransferase [Zunongwangia sp. HRR-M8]|uniref:glycosyltransferase n=1 Tax=Zunongwangia sp. HRR-M8 TaxID=3015170 RepID=UPI0022DD6A1B|nr:glycosyltransferase [Zunongwangia sp. HRR-M8]WBL22044.1 glycosyltransferase [Zunongwangia sp. HRR-M8]
MIKKTKALIFFQYLPPWRIDVFNEMSLYYDLTIAFTDSEREGFKYNRHELLNLLEPEIDTVFLNKGFRIGKRPIRFGVLSLIKSVKPKIIFSHEYAPTSILLAFYKRFVKYKYVITTSDNIVIAQSAKGLKAQSRKYVLKNADAVIVYSKRVMNWYRNVFPHLRVEVCPNIQNPESLLSYRSLFPEIINKYEEKFHLGDRKIILYSGRLEHVKGLDLLISAFAESNNKNHILVLVGEGSKKNELLEQSKSLGISDKVVFAGFCSGAKLYAWYDIANFYILPSRFEPFGAVVNEALIFGCPVLASKHIGAIDFISDKNGKLFEPLNKEKFVNELNNFYSIDHIRQNQRPNLMPVSFKQYVEVFNDFL